MIYFVVNHGISKKMTSESIVKSNCNMHCFSCEKMINKGQEITRCIETNPNIMTLRNSRKTGRWVHMYCLPTNVDTEYFVEVVEELMSDFPSMEYDEALECVETHKYWTHQEEVKFNKIVDEALEMLNEK